MASEHYTECKMVDNRPPLPCRIISGRAHIDVEHVCSTLDVDDDFFCRISMDPTSPSVQLVRAGAQLFIEASCCRVLLRAWMPEKVPFFDHHFSGGGRGRTLTAAEKKMVAMRQEWKCNRCKKILRDFEVDHVEQHCIRNQNFWLQALCPGCHREKTREDRVFADAWLEPTTNTNTSPKPIIVGARNAQSNAQRNVFSDYMLR